MNGQTMKSNKTICFLTVSLVLISIFSFGQKPTYSQIKQTEDSICKYGKKYVKPERTDIHFPEQKVSDDYKIQELHKAIPDFLNNEDNDKWWFYDYYFVSKLTDYDPIGDSTFTPPGDNFLYKLKDTYFLDFNGDGLLDFIHHPKYYMALMRNDIDAYEIFLKEKSGGYKWITFSGFIYEITFNKDNALQSMKTFQPHCCDDNHEKFYEYTFDKANNNLLLTKTVTILTCQLIKPRN
jgi:hypothetical protein